jgi:4-alpha-glucanotransferase
MLLSTLGNRIGDLPLVAEDLGLITPEVIALRKKYGLPGMAVLQFGFDAFDDNPHKPKNIHSDTVVYTGTHDNNTTLGWYQSLDADMQQHVRTVLGMSGEQNIVDTLIDVALDTKACLAVLPMQDLLHLGEEARMNQPGTMENNWKWRFDWEQLTPALVAKTRERLLTAGRAGV